MIAKTLALLVLPLVFASAHSLAATKAVDIVDFQFAPKTVDVNVGDTVHWTNSGVRPHTSTSDTGLWDSGTMTTGGSFDRVFDAEGTFNYHCTIHPSMTATVAIHSVVPNHVPPQTGVGLNGSWLTITLNAGDDLGKNADWWLVAMTPWGHWYSYAYPNSWVDIGTDLSLVAPAYRGPLDNISNLVLFDTKGIPSGGYVFYFGVDTNQNDKLDNDQLHYSSVSMDAP